MKSFNNDNLYCYSFSHEEIVVPLAMRAEDVHDHVEVTVTLTSKAEVFHELVMVLVLFQA